MRKVATIRKVNEILPIENADQIEVCCIDGWKVVCKVGQFKVDDLVIYVEPDAFVPTKLAPFLTKPGQQPREYQGVEGERLKTIKLRGQISQGLVLPTHSIPDLPNIVCIYDKDDVCIPVVEGQDVSELLGIIKWEPPLDASLQGSARGNFPIFINKTDQERVQNLKRKVREKALQGFKFEISEKLEGSSMTCYLNDDVFGVCSRNIDLTEDETSTYWKTARFYNIEEKLKSLADNYAFQGELVGPKIQGNPYKLEEFKFYIFDVFHITSQTYMTAEERVRLVNDLELEHVPVIDPCASVILDFEELLAFADGKSVLNPKTNREGLVYKSLDDPSFSFKVISNKYLLKQ